MSAKLGDLVTFASGDMSDTTIEKEWLKVSGIVLADGATETEKREAKRFFYAGAVASMNLMLHAVTTIEDEQEGAAYVEELYKNTLAGFLAAIVLNRNTQ